MTEITERITVPEEARSIETITAEINAIRGYARAVVLSAAVEIGRRLKEAKELLPHGEWGGWLEEKVDFSQVTASRYMKLFEEYADRQGSIFGAEVNLSTLKNLSVSNALRLLAVPAEEREEFAEEHDVEHLSAREMDKLIRERDEAREDAAKLSRMTAADAETITTLKKQIDELESRPVEVAVAEPDPAELQKRIDDAVADAVKEAKAAAAGDRKKLKDKLAETEKRRNELETELKNAKTAAANKEKELVEQQAGLVSMEKARLEREVEDLKKKLAMSDAAVASFNTLFKEWGKLYGQMIELLKGVEDQETREKMLKGLRFQLERFGEQVSGE